MLRYLEPDLCIVRDVQNEVHGLGLNDENFAAFKLRDHIPSFPPTIEVTDKRLLSTIAILVERWRKDDDHERKNRGEIATIVVAAEEGTPVLMDDRKGLAFAKARGVQAFTTQDLCVELAQRRKLKTAVAERIFASVRGHLPASAFPAAVEGRKVDVRPRRRGS
jgi:hypothetical protein